MDPNPHVTRLVLIFLNHIQNIPNVLLSLYNWLNVFQHLLEKSSFASLVRNLLIIPHSVIEQLFL